MLTIPYNLLCVHLFNAQQRIAQEETSQAQAKEVANNLAAGGVGQVGPRQADPVEGVAGHRRRPGAVDRTGRAALPLSEEQHTVQGAAASGALAQSHHRTRAGYNCGSALPFCLHLLLLLI